jgi:hypothetical protein
MECGRYKLCLHMDGALESHVGPRGCRSTQHQRTSVTTLRNHITPSNPTAISPQLLTRLALGQGEATCARPLSGWFALVFAARVCDRVDLYGFNGYSKLRRGGGGVGGVEERGFPYHYFDQVEGETGSHNFDITIKVLQLLALQINLTIH